MRTRSFVRKCIFAVSVLFFISPIWLHPFAELTNGWQYRWGNPSAFADLDGAGWNTAPSPYDIPGRTTNNLLWLKIKLPAGDWKDPVIHTGKIDQVFEVYMDNRVIYRHGNADNLLSGFAWHIIPLSPDFAGKDIFFKVTSRIDSIGFSEPRIQIGGRSEVLMGVVLGDIDKIILGFIIIALGLGSMVLFVTKINQTAFLSLGLFNVLLGIFIISQTQIKQLVFGDNYTAWGIIDLMSLYYIPVMANTFAKEILKARRNNPVYWVWVISAVFAGVITLLAIVNVNTIMMVLPFFKIALLVNIALVFVFSVVAGFRGNLDARIFAIGFAILSVFSVNNILQELRLVPKGVYLTHWGVFIFILVLSYILVNKIIIMYNQLKNYSDQLEEKNIVVGQTINQLEKLYDEIEMTQKEVILRLSEITEARSKETGNHVRRVAEYSRILALAAGLPQNEVDIIKLAAPMHDIGKLAIPDSILMKPGKLTAEEFDIIKTHTITGFEMLNKSKRDIFAAAAIIAYEHHEKFDGSGYPRKLKGKDIHIYGRITAIADVFDSLASDRCYKKAWPLDEVKDFMIRNRGIHFDPDLIKALFDNIDVFITIGERYKDEYQGDNPPGVSAIL